jgi:hypothetical protein
MTEYRNPVVRSMGLRRTFARLAVALAVLPVAVAMGAESASAEPRNEGAGATAAPAGIPGPFKILNKASGRCLDAPAKSIGGPVAQSTCNGSDEGQRWGWYNGGWLINLKRNECLGGEYINTSVSVRPCQEVANQYWRHQNFAIVNGQTGYCLEPYDSQAGTEVMSTTCRTSVWQNWQVTYW